MIIVSKLQLCQLIKFSLLNHCLVGYVQQVIDKLNELQYGTLASVTGRYYAMDRDKRHERNKIAYEGLVQGIGEETSVDNLIKVSVDRIFITVITP